MLKRLALATVLAACSSKPADLPPSCFVALDCCSALGPELEREPLRHARYACSDVRRFADANDGDKCEQAVREIKSSYWTAYPDRVNSIPPACEPPRR